MSSPITFSGFNNIDFSVVLNSLMAQASQPLTALQNQQTALNAQATNYTSLGTKLAAISSASKALDDPSNIDTFAATSSDSSAVSVSGGATAAAHYDIVVQELARAQVTASASTSPDANTTIVAHAGTLTIGGVGVTVTGDSTLQQLATAINGTANIGVTASVVRSAPNAYRLVLTSGSTGSASAFTVSNALTGGSGVSFTDTNGDGISGNTAADNAVQATDAQALVNNVQITSTSNALTDVISGATITLLKKDPTASIGVDVAPDGTALKAKVQTFVDAYNDLVKFATDQATSAAAGDPSSIGRDSLLRGLRNQLRSVIGGVHGAATDTYSHLSEVGVEFTQTGTIQLNSTLFDNAVANHPDGVKALFSGTNGAFTGLSDLADTYSSSQGILPAQAAQLTAQSSSLDAQISAMQDRLALQREQLQAEFTAADAAMSALQSQTSSLSSLSTSLTPSLS